MWLPSPLYEALPYLYLLAAVLVASLFGSALAYGSAALFAISGALVWRMRKLHRREPHDPMQVV